ncbi:hypothetical protein [Microvirga lotononidis]|uniref:Uncharacterized protein n=1 Tax=Microvirga lotononidis TaxID=864069 RepID=I4YSY2_9HYPH|nr:hypothetical protein [Microvirga lotononidis]EIM27074.1 hypothetical protein MicloDRAFT_00036280 [Microvirga lotononidis]WQO28737.1 hypothetical protein U0023_06595 [Microvirga lotononidis]
MMQIDLDMADRIDVKHRVPNWRELLKDDMTPEDPVLPLLRNFMRFLSQMRLYRFFIAPLAKGEDRQ